ncbi:hypothetical protein B0H19DRAFT_1082494 [Mycena capillaripes]|nr:hypothetical protein B0H19DRAFT_1082494 [Mycena capillaripes]
MIVWTSLQEQKEQRSNSVLKGSDQPRLVFNEKYSDRPITSRDVVLYDAETCEREWAELDTIVSHGRQLKPGRRQEFLVSDWHWLYRMLLAALADSLYVQALDTRRFRTFPAYLVRPGSNHLAALITQIYVASLTDLLERGERSPLMDVALARVPRSRFNLISHHYVCQYDIACQYSYNMTHGAAPGIGGEKVEEWVDASDDEDLPELEDIPNSDDEMEWVV